MSSCLLRLSDLDLLVSVGSLRAGWPAFSSQKIWKGGAAGAGGGAEELLESQKISKLPELAAELSSVKIWKGAAADWTAGPLSCRGWGSWSSSPPTGLDQRVTMAAIASLVLTVGLGWERTEFLRPCGEGVAAGVTELLLVMDLLRD